jgi:di/tricarboxylate transporter
VALAGLLALLLVGRFLLVERDSPGGASASTSRQYTVAMTVPDGSPLVGLAVGDAGLRNLTGVFLVEVERGDVLIAPVGPTERLSAGDRLIFVGDVSRVVDLHGIRGLEPAEWHADLGASTQRFFEVVVTPDSVLAGSTLKSVGFRARYAAAVVAVHRGGERLAGKLGTTSLHPGDVLLVLSDPGFGRRWRDHEDFLLVSGTPGESRPRRHHARFVQLVLLLTVGAAGTGLVDILPAALTAVGVLLVSRVITIEEARRSLDVNVLVLIAASFGLGAALTETGLAASLAGGLSSVTAGLGDPGLLIGILLATSVLTSAVNNNASAVLMWPIALATATSAGLDPRAFAVAVMLGASMDFLTPVGYQTNTMVYGMGGYRFADFPRLGFPLTIVTLATAAVVIPIAWPLR